MSSVIVMSSVNCVIPKYRMLIKRTCSGASDL